VDINLENKRIRKDPTYSDGGADSGNEIVEKLDIRYPSDMTEAELETVFDIGEDNTALPFVNRTNEIARVAFYCFKNARYPRQSQQYHFPIISHTLGAGKTRLADNYLDRLEDSKVVAAIARLLSEEEGDTLIRVKEMEKAKYVYIRASGEGVELLTKHLRNALCRHCDISQLDAKDYEWENLLEHLLGTSPVFLAIDEIGELVPKEQSDDLYTIFRKIRDSLGTFMINLNSVDQPKPLHVIFLGRTNSKFMKDLQTFGTGQRSGSDFPHKLIRLEPILPKHVSIIRKSLHTGLRNGLSLPCLAECEEVCAAVDNTIAELSGGIPRYITRFFGFLMVLQPQFQSEEQVEEWLLDAMNVLCCNPSFRADHPELDDEALCTLLGIRMLSKFGGASIDAKETFLDNAAHLPVMIHCDENGKCFLTVPPVFTNRLSGEKFLQKVNDLWQSQKLQFFQSPFGKPPYLSLPDAREYSVVDAVGIQLMIADISLDHLGSSCLTLIDIFPFLKLIGDVPRWVYDIRIPLTQTSLKKYFSLAGKKETPQTKYKHLLDTLSHGDIGKAPR